MKPAQFEYHAPERPDEVVGLLAELGDDAKVLSGGQSLIPMLAMRLTGFEHLIDIGRVDELRGIEHLDAGDGALRIGATTTEAAIEGSDLVADHSPLLARATPYIGHFQIRNRGTLGGCLAHSDPAAEYPAVALALDAELELLSVRGPRTVAASEFFTGLWSTALATDELLVGVTIPAWTGRVGFAIEEFARRHGDFAIAGAAVAVELTPEDRVARCSIALFGLGSTAVRARDAETNVVGSAVSELDAIEIGRDAMSGLTNVPADVHGSADFRRRVGATMVARAWTAAAGEALGD